MRPSFDPVTLAVPLFILTIVLEIVLARFGKLKANYEPKDTATSLLMGLGSTLAGLVTGGIVLAATIWVYQYRIFTIPMTAWWAWVLIFFLEDLAYYGFHRFSHERRLWWAAHVNHHTSQHYNLATALRQTWTGGINGSWIMWLPLSLLGFPPAMILIQKGISLVYQFWIHTEAIKRMPAWFEAVFNTPSHHRVHHARNPRHPLAAVGPGSGRAGCLRAGGLSAGGRFSVAAGASRARPATRRCRPRSLRSGRGRT